MSWIPKVEQKRHFCHKCKNELVFEVKMQRRDTCTHCGADLHVCKNCKLYDPNIHNQCREPEAAFIRDREESNFCAHFDFKDSEGPTTDKSVESAKAKLNDLFKNLK